MTQKKKRILIATDGSDFSELAVKQACEFIKANETQVVCFSAYESPVAAVIDPSFVTGDYYNQLLAEMRSAAEGHVGDAKRYISEHFSSDEVPVLTEVALGFPDRLIVDKAKEWDADLIVVGSHGRGFWGRLLGSVSTGVVHHAPCSVLVVKKAHETGNADSEEVKK